MKDEKPPWEARLQGLEAGLGAELEPPPEPPKVGLYEEFTENKIVKLKLRSHWMAFPALYPKVMKITDDGKEKQLLKVRHQLTLGHKYDLRKLDGTRLFYIKRPWFTSFPCIDKDKQEFKYTSRSRIAKWKNVHRWHFDHMKRKMKFVSRIGETKGKKVKFTIHWAESDWNLFRKFATHKIEVRWKGKVVATMKHTAISPWWPSWKIEIQPNVDQSLIAGIAVMLMWPKVRLSFESDKPDEKKDGGDGDDDDD